MLMQEHECDGTVIWEAQELHEFFRATVDRAAHIAAKDRGWR